MRKALAVFLGMVAFVGVLTACSKPADVASSNLSTAADNFQINRRIIFYNGITGETIAEIDGLCSLGNNDKQGELSVTCKTGSNPDTYIKDFLGLSNNVTYVCLQVGGADVSTAHYHVIWKPSTLIPNIDVQ